MGSRVRVSLAPNSGKNRGKVQATVVVGPSVGELAKAARNKLNVKAAKSKGVRLFVGSGEHAGVELERDQDVAQFVTNGTVVVVSLGEAFIFADGRVSLSEAKGGVRVPPPPFAPLPGPGPARGRARSQGPESSSSSSSSSGGGGGGGGGVGGVGGVGGGGGVESAGEARKVVEEGECGMWVPCKGEDAKAAQGHCGRSRVGPDQAPALHFAGPFPILPSPVLGLVREAVAGCDAFVERRHTSPHFDFVSFDYTSSGKLASMFPPPSQQAAARARWLMALRRECRGLVVCASSGQVLARRFHKFFNINETPETDKANIPFDPHTTTITTKIDGSLVSPILTPPNPQHPQHAQFLLWATKSAPAPAVWRFVVGCSEARFNELALRCFDQGATPLFEWCEAGTRVGVISHAASSLTLLAARDNVNGTYLSRRALEALAAEFNVPLTPALALGPDLAAQEGESALDAVMRVVQERSNEEGVVLTLEDGSMFKLKTQWYVSLAAASKLGGGKGTTMLIEQLKMRPHLSDLPDHVVWEMLLADGVDDILAACVDTLQRADNNDDARMLQQRASLTLAATERLHKQFLEWGEEVSRLGTQAQSRKETIQRAVATAAQLGWGTQMLVAYCHGNAEDALRGLKTFLRKLCSQARFDTLAGLLPERDPNEENKEQAGDGEVGASPNAPKVLLVPVEMEASFDDPPPGVCEHVVGSYLARKLGNYVGVSASALHDDAPVCIPREYAASEGKIKGMWERFRKDGVVDLRVDLQPLRQAGFTEHYGDADFANLLVQFGPSKVCKSSSRSRKGQDQAGAFAGVLLCTGVDHRFGDIKEAMRRSFDSKQFFALTIEGRVPRSVAGHAVAERLESDGEGAAPSHATPVAVKKVFLDLDGVLADFERGYRELTNRNASEVDPGLMWKDIKDVQGFFANLLWMHDGQELWNFVASLQLDEPPAILTGVPDGKNKAVKRQKKQWCKAHLGDGVEVVTTASTLKHKHAAPGAVLVDDNAERRRDWEAAGGHFILHTSARATIWQLKVLLGDEGVVRALSEGAQSAIQSAGGLTVPEAASLDIVLVEGTTNFAPFQSAVQGVGDGGTVGVDVEWRPDELIQQDHRKAKSRAALVQVATSASRVFVVDLLAATPLVHDTLEALLSNPRVLKLGFGMQEDILRLGYRTHVANALDLQAAMPLLFAPFHASQGMPVQRNRPSLVTAMRWLGLGCEVDKGKALQCRDWEERPIAKEHLQYAAMDAAVLVAMHAALVRVPELTQGLDSLTTTIAGPSARSLQRLHAPDATPLSAPSNPRPEDKPTVLFSGLFFSEDVKRALVERFPPVHPNVHADHVTLAFRPEADAAGAVGGVVAEEGDGSRPWVGMQSLVSVVGCVSDSKAQVLVVRVWDERLKRQGDEHYHVTVSTAQGVPPSYSNALLERLHAAHGRDEDGGGIANTPCDPPLDVVGTVGLRVAMKGQARVNKIAAPSHSAPPLPPHLTDRINAFRQGGDVGAHLKFRPNELTARERAAVHEFAEQVGLDSRSEGTKQARQLTLTITRRTVAEGQLSDAGGDEQLRVVSDAREAEDVEDDGDVVVKKQRGARSGALVTVLSPAAFSALVLRHTTHGGNAQQGAEQGEGSAEEAVGGGDDEQEADGEVANGAINWTSKWLSPERAQLECVLDGDARDDVRLAVVMRGIPGSGKSTVATLLAQAAEQSDLSACVCSADQFFAQGAGRRKRELAGKSEHEIYQESFNPSLLPAAHAYCTDVFVNALSAGVNVVVVDNTNVHVQHFEPYIRLAEGSGYDVVVVELLVESEQDVSRCASRSVHEVPHRNVFGMWQRWEEFAPAVRLRCFGSLPPLPSGPVSLPSLARFLSTHHCVHFQKSRAATHLIMSVEDQPVAFVSVPPALHDEFLRVFAADPTPKYLSELRSSPVFPLYVDVDFPERWQAVATHGLVHKLVVATQEVLRPQLAEGSDEQALLRAVVTAVAGHTTKPGFHLHFPGVLLTAPQALALRSVLVHALSENLPEVPWDAVVDKGVYAEGSGLRMVGSRKVTKGRDLGREYAALLVVDGGGSLQEAALRELQADRVALLHLVSVRTSHTQPNLRSQILPVLPVL